ncbi:short transient receptor potential channel 7-like [Limulus polyphemus]|uniref:Short transient receptor potential channel 7-like n=1 Tax=Limulus polyphemus TaxID=6850 RepID=A0ABM1T9R3_LIMPO|nr:short transient receptor potential channel 7-like [Limulus polyphemus]
MEAVFLMTFVFWIKAYFDSDDGNERKYWPSFDATLIHEGLLAIASILACGRLMYFCQHSRLAGPFQTSLEYMGYEILGFLFICFIIILSFATGLTRLYQAYNGMSYVDSSGTKVVQMSSFVSFDQSVKTLFWALFGMSPVEAVDIVMLDLSSSAKSNSTFNQHVFTEGVGHFLYAVYHLLILIVLVNTLIAMMTNSFQNIVNNVNVEWKFARTQMLLTYIDGIILCSSPFNLIYYLVLLCYKKVQKTKRLSNYWKLPVSLEDYHHDPAHYEALMDVIIRRYFKEKNPLETTV